MTQPGTQKQSKYQEVIAFVRDAITRGDYGAGARLPSESELVKLIGASRPTISRAMRELQATGLIHRRVGSGSYVSKPPESADRHQLFGLLIPRLGDTEIFESICGQIAREAERGRYGLFWSDLSRSADHESIAQRTCEPYVRQRVAGVFFAPLELSAGKDELNHRIVAILKAAGIAVVLLDRDLEPFPGRSDFDLVGIDNFAAGHLLGTHLAQAGCKHVAFVAQPLSADTVQGRIAGAFAALSAADRAPAKDWVRLIDASDVDAVKRVVAGSRRPDAIICANDKTAAELMQSLTKLSIRVPADIRVVGIDDVRYAKLLSPPLTTVHQPCQSIGSVAMQIMLDRVANPSGPPRHVMLPIRLVVRDSSGN